MVIQIDGVGLLLRVLPVDLPGSLEALWTACINSGVYIPWKIENRVLPLGDTGFFSYVYSLSPRTQDPSFQIFWMRHSYRPWFATKHSEVKFPSEYHYQLFQRQAITRSVSKWMFQTWRPSRCYEAARFKLPSIQLYVEHSNI